MVRPVAPGGLLAQHPQRIADFAPVFVPVQLDIVADAGGRPERRDAFRAGPAFRRHLVQHRQGVRMECAGRRADNRIVENARIRAGQFPGAEEGRPVDARRQVCNRDIVEDDRPGLRRPRRRMAGPVETQAVGPRRGQIGPAPRRAGLRHGSRAAPHGPSGSRRRTRACACATAARRRRRPRATHRRREPPVRYRRARSSPPCASGWSLRRRSAAEESCRAGPSRRRPGAFPPDWA